MRHRLINRLEQKKNEIETLTVWIVCSRNCNFFSLLIIQKRLIRQIVHSVHTRARNIMKNIPTEIKHNNVTWAISNKNKAHKTNTNAKTWREQQKMFRFVWITSKIIVARAKNEQIFVYTILIYINENMHSLLTFCFQEAFAHRMHRNITIFFSSHKYELRRSTWRISIRINEIRYKVHSIYWPLINTGLNTTQNWKIVLSPVRTTS